MQITVRKLDEAGYDAALYGLSLNKHSSDADTLLMHHFHMARVAQTLSDKDLGHNKVLEHIEVWFSVRAPRYFWQECDTYRMSSKQSESTVHTLLKGKLSYENFEDRDIDPLYLAFLNMLISEGEFLKLKKKLPEGFMQEREWKMSYKTLRNIILQRRTHKLPHWKEFIRQVLEQVEHPELLPKLEAK